MIKNFIKQHRLNTPLVESPFFEKVIENIPLEKNIKSKASKFHRDGYIIIDLSLSSSMIQSMKNQFRDRNSDNCNEEIKENSDFFSYNESPRIVDAGKWCSEVVDIALHEKVLDLLRHFYQSEPIPFSTINFLKGTEQPLHSDTIHFGTIPKSFLAACWVALEDVGLNNGGLTIVPGSHKLKDIDFYDLNISPPKNMKLVEDIYREYEMYIADLVKHMNLEKKIVRLRKGQALIWAANLLHGGSKIIDSTKTRFSQVTHYNFEGCKHYYHPFFSVPLKGKYVSRDVHSLNIKKYRKS